MTRAERLEAERRELTELIERERAARRSTEGLETLLKRNTNKRLELNVRARKRKAA